MWRHNAEETAVSFLPSSFFQLVSEPVPSFAVGAFVAPSAIPPAARVEFDRAPVVGTTADGVEIRDVPPPASALYRDYDQASHARNLGYLAVQEARLDEVLRRALAAESPEESDAILQAYYDEPSLSSSERAAVEDAAAAIAERWLRSESPSGGTPPPEPEAEDNMPPLRRVLD
jgi:hypothetical protein